MEISQFFMNGDIKGAIAYMREHEEFKDILPAYVAIFENSKYRRFDVPDKLNEILLLYQIYYRDTFYCGLPEAEAAVKGIPEVDLIQAQDIVERGRYPVGAVFAILKNRKVGR